MPQEKTLDIIKDAILLERRGKAFYQNIVNQTQSDAVKDIFQTMAEEEDKHINILTDQFKNVVSGGKPEAMDLSETPAQVADSVLTETIKKQIHAASYEAAAISAAMAMEERAVAFYSEQADLAENAEAKELYNWLANWEKTHLQFLSDLDQELKESVWYDNQFWPMM